MSEMAKMAFVCPSELIMFIFVCFFILFILIIINLIIISFALKTSNSMIKKQQELDILINDLNYLVLNLEDEQIKEIAMSLTYI